MRRKIWQDTDVQCSIIGTCLRLAELKKIAKKTKLRVDDQDDAFQLHAMFVRLCNEAGPVSRAVNKLLDRKFSACIRRYASARSDDELLKLWDDSKSGGDIPGPYWALMTHPDASVRLRKKVFGDVHMLSHLVGSSNRADIRRLGELEKLTERMAKTKNVYRKRIKSITSENKQLRKQVVQLSLEVEKTRSAAPDQLSEELHLENQKLMHKVSFQDKEIEELREMLASLEHHFEAQEKQLEALKESEREKEAEVSFLEEELRILLSKRGHYSHGRDTEGACSHCAGECPGHSLIGKRILYVGGRTHLVPYYRDLVECRGGEFIHHDGGIEQACSKIPKLLNGADFVFCPVDCVSHNACQCVKQGCRHRMLPCRMLRSSGLSSLVRCLEEIMDEPLTAGEEHGVPVQHR